MLGLLGVEVARFSWGHPRLDMEVGLVEALGAVSWTEKRTGPGRGAWRQGNPTPPGVRGEQAWPGAGW